MKHASSTHSHGAQLLNVLMRYRRRWLLPLVGCTVLAGAYAFLRTPKWEASQTVLLRNEAVSSGDEVLGRFRSVEDLQLTQETVLEVAQSHSVLKAVLQDADRPATAQDIADLRDVVSVVPPEGAATPTVPTTTPLGLDPSSLGGELTIDPSTMETPGS